MNQGVAVKATINRMGSAASGGIKLTLDIPETEAENAAELLKNYLHKTLSVAFVIEPKP